MKKLIMWVLVVCLILVVVLIMINKNYKPKVETEVINKLENKVENNSPNYIAPDVSNINFRDFSMVSLVQMVDGKPKPQFSLKEITINKGDKVRIKITSTDGIHDFKIDEYGIYSDTKLNIESVVEFTADKSGDFIYYCTKPGHRQNGQWGTLKVLDK